MKTTKKYGLILCMLTPGIIWVYLEFTVPSYKKWKPVSLTTDSIKRVSTARHPTVNPLQANLNKIHQQPDPWWTTLPSVGNQSNSFGTTTQMPVYSSKHIVVILSYMRSGSTLTADILQHYRGTVYVFEPFHSIIVRTREGKPLFYLNGTIKYLKEEDLTDEFLVDELHKWFTCSYEELDVHSLTDNLHGQFSRSMRPLVGCVRSKKKTVKGVRECLPKATQLCEQATNLLFKFIRLPMGIVEDVFEFYPNLQVVHLLRDPRGLLTSQIKLAKSQWDQIEDTSRAHCDRVWNDLNSTVYLNTEYPERCRILLYENLAENPLEVAKRLYNFVGFTFLDNAKRYLSKLTIEGRKDSSVYSIIRGNSTKTAYSWRDKIAFADLKVIDKNCAVTYQFLGYQIMPFETAIRDRQIPTFISPNKTIII